MRPCGANYENQCSSKWGAHGGGLRGTCEEEPGVEVPPKATARWAATRGSHRVPSALSRPADRSSWRWKSPPPTTPPPYPNDPTDVNRRQMRKSQRGGAAGGCTQHCKHTSVFRVRVWRSVRTSQCSAAFDWLIFPLWLQGSVKNVNLLGSPAGLRWL